MPRQLALLLCFGFIYWLFRQERHRTFHVSSAIWIVLIWTLILGSRPLSAWLGVGRALQTTDDYVEGSPLDRTFLLILIAAAFAVLVRRKARLSEIFSYNKWLFLLYGYFLLTILWSAYPDVSFKRWIKDLGNIVIVLVLLTEEYPGEAVSAVFRWCAFILLPFSALFIKYYPQLGRAYSKSGGVWNQGVTLTKNELGALLMMTSLFVFWDWLEQHERGENKPTGLARLHPLALLIAYLFHSANSATSLTCLLFGMAFLWALRREFVLSRIVLLRRYIWVIIGGVFVLDHFFDLAPMLTGLLGRDSTLTGRTDIWKLVLAEKTNPLLGTGFDSFWLGERVDRFWHLYSFHLNEAHNGYLETYLNTGIIGVTLLVLTLAISGRKMFNNLVLGSVESASRLAVLVMVVIYNWSEAAFNRQSLIWFGLLLVIMESPNRTPQAELVVLEQYKARNQSLLAEESEVPDPERPALPFEPSATHD